MRIVEERARASAAVEVLFDARVAIAGEQCFLLGKQIGIVLFGGCEDAVAFGDFRKHGLGKRISEMKGDEVKAFFFFPMRKATAIANVDFAVTRLHGTVEERGRIFLRHGVILLRLPERGRGRPRYSRPGGRRYADSIWPPELLTGAPHRPPRPASSTRRHIGSQVNPQGAASARLQHRQIPGGLGVDHHAKAVASAPESSTSTAWSAVICRKTPVLGPPL